MKIEKYIDTVSGEELEKRIYYENDKLIIEAYYLEDKIHRSDGPAIAYYESGKITSKHYLFNGKWHRDNGPTYIEYNEDSSIKKEIYYLNGTVCDILQEVVIRGLETEIENNKEKKL